MKKIFFVPALAIVFLASCKNKSEEEEKTVTPVQNPLQNNNAQVNPGDTNNVTQASVNSNTTANPTGSKTSVTPQAPAVTTSTSQPTAGLNPAHGQPGHRCDIPVGSPLNSPPGQTNPVVTTSTPPTSQTVSTISTPPVIQTAPAVQPVAGKTPPGMNPPHGEPGHRCDIAVGAPLNSPKGGTQPISVTPVTTNPTPVKQ